MPYGVVEFKTFQAPSSTLPSPVIWANAQGEQGKMEGVGYSVIADFKSGTQLLTDLPAGAALAYDANYDSAIQLGSGSTGTYGAAVYTRPVGNTGLNSQNKLCFEAIVAIQQVSTQAMFVGLSGLLGLTGSTGPVLVASATAGSNTLISTTSLIGFWMLGSSTQNFNAIYQNQSAGVSTVLAGALSASVFTSGSTQNQLQGAQTGTGIAPPTAPYPLTTSTFVKLGLVYDGISKWAYYVNGIQVATQSAIGTTDNSTSYGGVVAIAGGTATQVSTDIAYFRIGYAPSNN